MMTEDQLASINAFLQTNPSAEALAAAQAQYGVSNADVARAREYGATGSAPGSSIPNQPAGPVVGGGGYDSRPTVSAGTMDQGYSQNYSPDQIEAIRGTFKQYENDPQKLMSLMTQYGVSVNDLALANGGSVQGYQNKFLQAGASQDFGGMSDHKATTTDKAYIDWMLTQPNPAGQGTLADVYKRQGIDPYNDPRVLTQAREQSERATRRADMYGGTSSAPMDQIAPWQDSNWQAKQASSQQAERERQARMVAASPNVVVGGGAVRSTAPVSGSAMSTSMGGQATPTQSGGLISSQIASPRAAAPSMATVGARPRQPQGGIVNSALMDPNTNFNQMVYGDANNRYVSQADANKSPTIASMLVYNPYYANKAPGG